MGALTAAVRLPFLLFGLVVGVWVDRWRRRPVLLWSLGAYGLLLLTIPAAAALNRLTFAQLVAVGFLTGAMTLLFDVAEMAFIPTLVGRGRLLDANTRFGYTSTGAQVLGPSLAGGLVQAVTAPLAVLVDGFAALLAAAVLLTVPGDGPSATSGQRRHLLAEVREGLAFVLGHPLLRAIAASVSISNFCAAGVGAVLVLFAMRDLHFSPALLGVVFTLSAPAGLLGVALAGTAGRRIGIGPAMVVGCLCFTSAPLLLPWLPPASSVAVAMLWLFSALTAFGGIFYNLNQLSMRQALTPHRLQGRMSGTIRFLVWGALPPGAALGGLLAEAIGMRWAIWTFALGSLGGLAALLVSPLRSLREAPPPPD